MLPAAPWRLLLGWCEMPVRVRTHPLYAGAVLGQAYVARVSPRSTPEGWQSGQCTIKTLFAAATAGAAAELRRPIPDPTRRHFPGDETMPVQRARRQGISRFAIVAPSGE